MHEQRRCTVGGLPDTPIFRALLRTTQRRLNIHIPAYSDGTANCSLSLSPAPVKPGQILSSGNPPLARKKKANQQRPPPKWKPSSINELTEYFFRKYFQAKQRPECSPEKPEKVSA